MSFFFLFCYSEFLNRIIPFQFENDKNRITSPYFIVEWIMEIYNISMNVAIKMIISKLKFASFSHHHKLECHRWKIIALGKNFKRHNLLSLLHSISLQFTIFSSIIISLITIIKGEMRNEVKASPQALTK